MIRRRRPGRELKTAVDALPLGTRRAMLEGIEANRIIVGAYTDRQGGVCPMLAAHRNGGRTSLASFAEAWDDYTRAKAGIPREATEGELQTLRAVLRRSIVRDEAATTKRRPKRRSRDAGERERTRELASRSGWAWPPYRSYDEYQQALRQLETPERRRPAERELQPA